MQLKVESVDVNGEGSSICLEMPSTCVVNIKFNADIDINEENTWVLIYIIMYLEQNIVLKITILFRRKTITQ